MKKTPGQFAKLIMREGNFKRFLIIAETNEGKALILCWNGKEFHNQIDQVGLYALGSRAFLQEPDGQKELGFK